MLQPKYAKQLDSNIKELIANGGSNEDIDKMASDYTSMFSDEALKKKEKSNATAQNQKSASETNIGSLDGKLKFRLPDDSDYNEMQNKGILPPDSEVKKRLSTQKTIDRELLLDNQSVKSRVEALPKTPVNTKATETEFKQRGTEKLISDNPDFTEELYNFTTKDKEEIKKGIDLKIENNDLNLDHPYLYFSSYNKKQGELLQPKDEFVNTNFGDDKLSEIGINAADFDGFLNKKGYKAEFLDKEAKGLFDGNGTDVSGGYNIQLAKEIQKERLLNLYMQDINSRDYAKRKLNQEKVNLEKSGADQEEWDTQYTLFDSNKVGAFYEKEMPILTQKLKERDAENRKIYDTHKNGDAGFFYGTKQVLKSGWNGFLDRVVQTSSTMLDKIGLDSLADESRFLNEENQIQRPNTRDVGYASGKTTIYDGVKYLVTDDGQIIDQDKKIRVTDLFFKPTYDAIVNQSKKGEEDSVFSFQGSAIQTGGVLGDMIVQIALTRGVGLASGATVKAGSLLSKIPISKSIGSAIIAQSALGYSQGLEQTYKAAIDAGIDEKTAKVLATDAAQRMAGLYAVTAPISPQTKAIQAIFGTEGKELIKKAIAAYTQTGKKGFVETFKGGIKVLAKNGAIFSEEGGKEVFQENIQQYGENYGVNHVTNRESGRELVKETISGDEFVNTSILSFASGGLMTLPGMFSSTDKLKTLQQLSKDPLMFEKNLKELVSKGVFTNDKADILRKDVKIYSNQSHKIPKNLNKDIAMDVMTDLQEIQDLEAKKKTLDKSFHEDIDAEIETKRTLIKDRIKFDALSKKEITELKSTAKKELIQEAKDKDEDVSKIDNAQIVERANKIYSKQLKDAEAKTPTPEAQPQAEVPQQAEAEKVAEVSPEVADVEKRRQAEIKKYDERDARSLEAITPNNPNHPTFKVGMKRNAGDNVIVDKTNTDNWNGEGDGYTVITAVKSPAEFDSNGKMTKAAKVEEGIFNSKEEADAAIQATFEKVKNSAGKAQEKANAKYDAELEALKTKETPKPQEVSPVEDVVAPSVVEGETKKINGKELTFYKLEGDNTDSGFAVEKNKDGYVIQSALLPFSKQKQGIGTDFYVRINNESIEKTGSPLKSSENLSNSGGKPFWEKLVDKGLAEKTEDGFKFKEQTKVTNETAPSQDSTIDGNVRLGASNVGESGTTEQQSTAKENLSSSVERGKSEGIDPKLKHAKEQIEKGVLQWSGDMSSPRIDLGLSWADIRKGESDIKNGKENTVPAKRLIEALDKAKQEGGYHYKYGTGGESQRGREFVSLEDVQRATNEIPLTDSELEQINREQEQLAKEHENDFNSLTEKEQIEILENYENRIDNQGKVSENTEIGKSKNDVSNEKTPNRKESRKKIAEAKVDDIVNAINGIDSIFGIKIKVDDVDGLNKNGIDIVNVIASIVKQAVNAGIDVDEAIKKTIEHLKKTIVFDVNINDVKEKLGVEKPKSNNKNPLREKSSEEISDELGISEKEYLDLKAFVANEPSSGIFNEYLSADTIADVFGDGPTNDQQYEQMVLMNAVQHGNSVLEKARSIFGENYMTKTLEFLQNVKLGNFEKAMVYAALENEIDTSVKANPSNKVYLATQRLIYADSQANLRNSSKGLNAGRLRRIHNAIKNGYDIDKLTSGLIKPEQQEAKQILKEAIPTGENLNKASEQEENTEVEKPRVYTQEEFEAELKKAVQASVGKNRNELSKKGKDIADKIRRLKLNKDVAKADLSLGTYDLAIEAIAQLVEKGATVAQAIKNVLSDVKYKDIDADKLRQDILGVVNTPRIKDVVKQALIDAGFSREITVTKNAKDANGNDVLDANGKKVKVKETKEVLDWNKLTGRMNSVEALRSNVEDKLKEQGYTDSQIEEISNELESEYKRLTEYIADKALTELERRNQIPKQVNRKSNLDRLVDYHSKGLFGESAKNYERLINKIVGITKREQDVLDKIEAEIEKIKNLREVKIDGSFPDAQSIESQASYIAKSIRNIIAWSNLVNSPLKLQIITVLSDIAGISRAAVLGNLYNAFQNIYSNNRAGFLARMKFKAKGYWTPELNDAFNELKKTVTSDVLLNRGLDFGDVVSPFSHHSIFIEKLKDYINKKYPEGVKRQRAIGALNTFEGRLFLNVMDSRFKSKIVNIDFVMNLVDVLTSERAGKSKMTKEEAVNFVSESLTGVNLEKAKVLAKKFIDDVNAMKEGTLLKNEDNIKRLAFDIVRENLTSGNNFTMDEINDIYQASMKSGGVNIGHESNNIVSEELKSLNNRLEKKIEDAMKEKDYDKATKYATYAFVSKNILYPYMSGGLNWAVLEAEAGTPLGLATGAYKSYKNKNLDLLTDVGRKRMKQDLINKRDSESKLFRGIWGTSIGVSAYLAYYGLQAVSGVGDDDEENKRIFNKYLREHPEQRKIFDKFSPEVYAVSLAVSDERLSKYLLNKMGYKTDQNDNVLTLLKSLQNKNSSTAGALGVLLGQITSTPGAWRILRDTKRLYKELQGEPMSQTEQRVTSFLNGYFKGALVDYLGLRPGTNYDLEKVKKEIQNKKTDFTNYTNGIANDVNSKKITIEDAQKLVKNKYEGNDELLGKAKEIIENSVNDKQIREGLKDADIWYMEMYNEKDIRAKAYIYYQNVLSKKDFKEDKNFSKYMNLALFGKEEEYITEFMDLAIEYKDIQESKKKPIN